MSGLGNLFGGSQGGDSLDALKYTAPKEPQRRNPVSSATPSSPQTPTTSAPAAQPQVLASTSIRLYKINPSTNAYEAHDGGNMLGCVIMATGSQYSMLIYNGQRVPQANVILSPSFVYNIRDTYMSFSDGVGNNWSALFDSVDGLQSFLRAVVACLVQVANHFSPSPIEKVIKGALPPIPGGSPDDPPLHSGMSAGIYYSIWELGDPSENPVELLKRSPGSSVLAPGDVCKIKIGSGEDPIGGLSEALTGMKKGDRLVVGIPPRLAYGGSGDMNWRKRPESWLVIELEINRIKSDKDKKKDKKEKGSSSTAAPEPQIVQQQQQPQQQPQQQLNPQYAQQHNQNVNGDSGNDVTTRMAALAGQSGAFRMPMPANEADARRFSYNQQQQGGIGPQSQNSQLQHQSYQNPSQQYSQQGYTQAPPQQQQQQQQQQQPSQAHHQHQPQGYSPQQMPPLQQSTDYNPYAMTIVEGQGVRGFYSNNYEEGGNMLQRLQHQQPQHQQQQQQQQQQQHQQQQHQSFYPNPSMSSGYPMQQTPAPQQNFYGHQLPGQQQQQQPQAPPNQLQSISHASLSHVGSERPVTLDLVYQSIVEIQTSLNQVHLKLGGNHGVLGNSTSNGLTMQQLLLLQSSGSSADKLKMKGTEIVSSVQALVEECDKVMKESGAGGAAHRAAISKLEERVDVLQARNDVLMNEKTALLEKQTEMLHQKAEIASKSYGAQFELETLRSQKSQLESSVASLRESLNRTSDLVRNADLERARTVSLEQEVASLKSKLQLIETATRQSVEESWQLKLTEQTGSLRRLLEEKDRQLTDILTSSERKSSALQAEVDTLRAQAALPALPTPVDLYSSEVQSYVAQQISAALARGPTVPQSALDEMESLREELSKSRDRIAALQTQLDAEKNAHEATKASNATSSSASEELSRVQSELRDLQTQLAREKKEYSLRETKLSDKIVELEADLAQAKEAGAGKLAEDTIKDLMQSVYAKACEVFMPEGADEDVSAQGKRTLKSLRSVLKSVSKDQ